MKKITIVLLLLIAFSNSAGAQIICIYCYDQNAPVSTGVTNLISNGGFENHNCIPQNWFNSSYCPNSNYYNCTINNWTCTNGGPSTYADIVTNIYSHVPEGTFACYMGNHYCYACAGGTMGDTSCIVNLGCTAGGIAPGFPISEPTYGAALGLSLEQTVTGLTTGNIYVLEFWAGGEVQPYDGMFALDIGFGDTLLRCKSSPPGGGIGRRYIVEFLASSSSHTFKFTNWGHINNQATEVILDDVMLYTIGELSPAVPVCPLAISDKNNRVEDVVYPNPFGDKLSFRCQSKDETEFALYDITSQLVTSGRFYQSVQISTGQLAEGLYFFELRNNNGIIRKGKLIKNN